MNKCSYCYATMIDYCEHVVKYNRGGLYSDLCTLHLWGVDLFWPEWQSTPQSDNMTCATVVNMTQPPYWVVHHDTVQVYTTTIGGYRIAR